MCYFGMGFDDGGKTILKQNDGFVRRRWDKWKRGVGNKRSIFLHGVQPFIAFLFEKGYFGFIGLQS